MKASLAMASLMEWANIHFQMQIFMKDASKMDWCKVKEHILGTMVENIQANGLKIKCMATESFYGKIKRNI